VQEGLALLVMMGALVLLGKQESLCFSIEGLLA
jgi:hypothetical protein